MRLLKKFSYPDIFQRRVIFVNFFFTFITIGFIYTDISFSLKYYFIYQPVFKIVFLCGLIGLFFGNIIGRVLFTKIKNNRLIFILSNLLFLTFCFLFLYREIIITSELEPLIYIFFQSPYYILLILFIITFTAGININYCLKILCGEFIDDKKGTIPLLLLILIGITGGILLSIALYYYNTYYISGLTLLFILPTIFIIKLPYNPSPIYAQGMKDHEDDFIHGGKRKDDLFFTYLNFTYLIIYFYLGIESIIKFYGDFLHIKLAFLAISLCSMIIGVFTGRISRRAFWYIYVEMLYPIVFLTFLVLLYIFNNELHFFAGISLFIPASIIFGFSLYHTTLHIISYYGHNKRFNIITFSMFLLPVPILISLSYIDFTNLWYFILLYLVMITNIVFPGIHFLQEKIGGYKKALYLFFSLIFIPIVIIQHLYLNIPIDNNLYIRRTKGFDVINNINYNSEFIKNKAVVSIFGLKTFTTSDSINRDIKRSIITNSLYLNLQDRILFIDGSQKFYRNPIFGYFENATCLDYIPDRTVDLQRLPISGENTYTVERSNILLHLQQKRLPFKIICDVPNIFDQTLNPFRFSEEYYRLISKNLTSNGIFVQIYDLANCRHDIFLSALTNLKRTYNKGIGFLFSKHLVIMTSNDDDALNITKHSINRIKRFLRRRKKLSRLFYNEIYILSHLIFTKIDEIKDSLEQKEAGSYYFLDTPKMLVMDNKIIDNYISNNSLILELITINNNKQDIFRRNLGSLLKRNHKYLSLLKEIELACANEDYEKEITNLFNLKKITERRADLNNYLREILSLKENHYFHIAVELEKKKKWEEAKKLYKAILIINENNFNANYRLGILCITLQSLDESFIYLQRAMKLKKDDPKVLYQMGVLLFSDERPKDALVYLGRALRLKENTPSIFFYLGLCNEKLGNLNEAKSYYDRAIRADTNDIEITLSLERIKRKIADKKKRWNPKNRGSQSEVEEGEDIPLPINESAREIRTNNENKYSSDIK